MHYSPVTRESLVTNDIINFFFFEIPILVSEVNRRCSERYEVIFNSTKAKVSVRGSQLFQGCPPISLPEPAKRRRIGKLLEP